MLPFIQSLNSFAGLISIVLLLVVAIVSGRSMSKSNVNHDTIEAQEKTINAMKEEMGILRGKIDDVKTENADIKKENTRLQLIMETISAALKGMGLIITIEGDMVRILNNGSSITKKIQGQNGQLP
jgi:regulator of replication initiation timing